MNQDLYRHLNKSSVITQAAASTPKASAKMPPLPLPKAKSSKKAVASFLTSAKPSDSVLPSTDLGLANVDISQLRYGATTKDTLNKLSKASPDLSAAVSAAIRMSVTAGETLIVTNPDGTINEEGVRLGQQLIRRFNSINMAATGFNPYPSMRSLSESMARELLLYGSCSAELVLGKGRIPEGIMPVSTTKVKFKTKQNRLVPIQVLGSEEVPLDIPTYFYVALDQDLTEAYSDSPVQAAMQPMIAANDFMNDLRRIFRKAIHPRQAVKIDEERWRKNVPPDVLHDEEKLTAYMAATIADIEEKMNGLSPEDAIVYFDTLEFATLTNNDVALSDEYKTLAGIIDGKMAAGTKTAGIVLGHASASSQNIASTSSMLFVKTVEGAVQLKLNELYSRLFTTALRLFGLDVVASYAFKNIDLRPELELEAFKAMKQSRVLGLLSVGMISDTEASIELTGSIPAVGAPKLSGTMFLNPIQDSSSNPTSNTSSGQGSALNRDLSSNTPTDKKTNKA